MPKIRLIAATLFWSAVTVGSATLALVEVVESKPDRVGKVAVKSKGHPQTDTSVWADDAGTPYRRRSEPLDRAVPANPAKVIPTVWQDPPRR